MENSAPYLEIGCPHCGRVNRVPTERLEQGPSCGHCKAALFDGQPQSLKRRLGTIQPKNGGDAFKIEDLP